MSYSTLLAANVLALTLAINKAKVFGKFEGLHASSRRRRVSEGKGKIDP